MNAVQQVGGTHYAAAYQHWDWAVDTGLDYMEGNASAYVTRFKKKGGIIDLEKAVSYMEKLRQKFVDQQAPIIPAGVRPWRDEIKLTRFLLANDLVDTLPGFIIKKMDSWRDEGDLLVIIYNLQELINETRV
ncbi:DUF3310 domain-containing protein [Rhizobium phage RHph_I72]|nr:DUF3310 domain-containing protein [Rhizobium phage RHph_I65]QIG76458.1 DUF3310 domain-containing protein [Rhizobium phage RHph_I72]